MMMLGNKQSPWYQNYCTYMQLFTTFIDVVRFFLLACIVNHQSKHSIAICAFAAPLLSAEIIYRVLILFWSLCLPKLPLWDEITKFMMLSVYHGKFDISWLSGPQ